MMTWVTYAELASARKIDRKSAARLVSRRRFPKRQIEDGSRLMQVLVPPDVLMPEIGHRSDSDVLASLLAEVAALREDIARLAERLTGSPF